MALIIGMCCLLLNDAFVAEAQCFEQTQEEVRKLQEVFGREVFSLQPEAQYCQAVIEDAARLMNSAAGIYGGNQFFVYADRDPQKQNIMVGFWDDDKDEITVIGWDKISTGDPKHGKDYHFTPTGIFLNSTENLGYRAQGTKNSKGWRGFGAKGSRVWDFGWQETTKPCKRGLEQRTIRLLMHATDPDQGEKRLGRPDSKGCVRISARLNKFLDVYGIIDAEYENAQAVNPSWLLRKDRQPIMFAGRYMLVGDAAQTAANAQLASVSD